MPDGANWLLAAILAAFGIAAPVPEIAAGLFLAVASAFLVMAFTPPERRLAYWLTLAGSLFCALVAAILQSWLVPDWPIQLVMFAGGGLSRYLAAGLIAFGHAMEGEMGELPGELSERMFKPADALSQLLDTAIDLMKRFLKKDRTDD